MADHDQQLKIFLKNGLKRAQFLAQAAASLKYDDLNELMGNAMQAFVIKEYALLKTLTDPNKTNEQLIYTSKRLSIFLSQYIVKLSEKRQFDQRSGLFYKLSQKDRVVLIAHYLLKMDSELLGEVVSMPSDAILESLARAEAQLVEENTLFADLPLLMNECTKVTRTITFARGLLDTAKSSGMDEHIQSCKVCGKANKFMMNTQDRLMQYIPAIELTDKDRDLILKKALEGFYSHDLENSGKLKKHIHKIAQFFNRL